MRVPNRSDGFTLIELLTVIAVIAILVSLMLPAINAAREAARRAQCLNHLRQIGVGVIEYEAAVGVLPPLMERRPGLHSWFPRILSFVEENAALSRLNVYRDWDHISNQEAVNTFIPILLCPSTAASDRRQIKIAKNGSLTAAPSDYAPPGRVTETAVDYKRLSSRSTQGALDKDRGVPLKQVTDGTSHTMLAIEDAGRPEHWVRGGRQRGNSDNHCNSADVTDGVVTGGAWADPRNDIPLHGFQSNGLICPGDCAINCTNNNEAFSFHPGGAQLVLLDGSAHYLSESTEIHVYAALVTRDGGEPHPDLGNL